jgi:hypothetical protein
LRTRISWAVWLLAWPALEVSGVEQFTGPFPSWTNVKTARGAKGNGVADDTAIIQKALDRLGGASAVLYFPAGTYRLTATLRMTDKIHVAMVGEDPATTTIRWDGPAGGDMLRLNGVRYSRWERITWDGARRAGSAVRHLWDGKSGAAATALTHLDEVFENAEYGIRAGDAHNKQDAEGSVVRSKFLRCSKAGISIESWNALNWWIRDSEFVDNARGVTNLANSGNFHVYGSLFRNSTVADVAVTGNLFFSLRGNTSSGSRKFLAGANIGRNNQNLTLERNRVIRPLDSEAIVVENLGTLLLLDNRIESRAGAAGPVVRHNSGYPGVSTIAIGNTFNVSSPIATSSQQPILIDNATDPRLELKPPAVAAFAPPARSKIFEVPRGSGAAAIQRLILAAAAGEGSVVHLPAGVYRLEHGLEVPAGAAIRLIGDSQATVLEWAGAGGGAALTLAGPSRAELWRIRIRTRGSSDGIRVGNADQPGARVLGRQLYLNGSTVHSVLADNLNHTRVVLQGCLHYYSGAASSVRSTGGQAGGGVVLYGSVGNGLGSRGSMYETGAGGRLLVLDAWMEGSTPAMARLGGSGTMTFSGGHYDAWGSRDKRLFRLDGFRGTLTVANAWMAGYVQVRNPGPDSRVLLLGVDHRDGGPLLDRSSGAGIAAALDYRQFTPGTGYLPVPNAGPSGAEFVKSMLSELRKEPAATGSTAVATLPPGVTDVRMYEVAVEGAAVAIRISR